MKVKKLLLITGVVLVSIVVLAIMSIFPLMFLRGLDNLANEWGNIKGVY